MNTGTVFVIDDDLSVRKALARLLRSAGLRVQTLSTAEEFLSIAPPEEESCVILDVKLPGLSGLDLQAELIRADRETPIIFITGHGDVPMTVRAMKAGALDFLEKPFNDSELLDAIDRALEKDRRLRAERAERQTVMSRYETLTPREREVMALVVKGLLNKQIAANLGASEKTIKVHRSRVMRKMKADSVPDLVRMARRCAAQA